AGQNMLFNQITVFGLRSQFEITIVVVDRLGGISFLLIEQASQFKMCRSGLRIDLKCLFKTLACSWIVHSADPAFSSQKMRLLFLVGLALAGRHTAGWHQSEQQRHNEKKTDPKHHGATLNKRETTFNVVATKCDVTNLDQKGGLVPIQMFEQQRRGK